MNPTPSAAPARGSRPAGSLPGTGALLALRPGPRQAGPLRRLGTVLAAAALLLAGLFATAPAAQAHDELIGSDPADGQVLDEAPEEITLTFSANITEVGNAIRVTDSQGETVSTGEVQVDGTDAVQRIDAGAADETYRVVWRIVSSDGHPIEGSYDFSVGAGGSSSEASGSSAAPSAEPSLSGSADDAAQDAPDDGLPTWVVALIGAVVALVVLVMVWVVVARVRASRRD
ncbi:copper resistance CopC family protein [Rothia halotolerans]|uniref:copper resistance CopC family protein n=1 Tax=Rothia halotolerans TaxID=405770 RepID=UPI00101DFFDE|nr:copper resistance CopC family protein [Rothia halotolerans]